MVSMVSMVDHDNGVDMPTFHQGGAAMVSQYPPCHAVACFAGRDVGVDSSSAVSEPTVLLSSIDWLKGTFTGKSHRNHGNISGFR